MRRDVFQAIADSTRREILQLLATQNLNVNTIARHFDISRVAISKHLKILAECGLIDVAQQGRERTCQAQLDNLAEVSAWIEQYRQHWEKRLDALEIYLDTLQKNKTPQKHDNPRKKKTRAKR